MLILQLYVEKLNYMKNSTYFSKPEITYYFTFYVVIKTTGKEKKQYLGYIQIIKSSFQVHLSHRGAFKKLPAF